MLIRLTHLLPEVHALLASAQVRWHVDRYESLVEAARWSAALDTLEKLAQTLVDAEVSERGWRMVLTSITFCAARGDLLEDFLRLFDAYGHRAFGHESAAQPWQLREAFVDQDSPASFATCAAIGEFLAGRFPTCPLGYYVSAHFGELVYTQSTSRSSASLRQMVQNLESAARLADDHSIDRAARHGRLRLGVLLLKSGLDRERGRHLLKAISPDTLVAREQLWYALGMLHSPFWLDRVRSADVLDALAEGRKRARPGYQTVEVSAIREAASALFHASPFELQSAEEDRLTELAATLFAEREAATWRELLQIRPQLRELHALPLDRASEALPLLNQLARQGESYWFDVFHQFARLQAAWSGADGQSSTALTRPVDEERYRISVLTSELLDALERDPASSAVTTLLASLRDELRNFDGTHDAMALKPVTLLWPRLFERLDQLADRTALDPIAASWVARAPEPSYGFWPLAAHFIKAELHGPARAVARRALGDASPAPNELRLHVVGHLVDHAIAQAEPEHMLFWLEQLKRLEAA
ncbi:MAG: hypothetical protein H0U74_14545 [Bradymonadaceae bacterium]|nr:hypothetical protein [Lujinxingiaceae bacterium]